MMAEQNINDEKDKMKSDTKPLKVLDGIITFSLVALFFGLPIFFTGLTFQGIAFEKEIYFYFWVLVALIAWATKSVMSGEMKIKRTPIDIPIVIFFFVYLLATIFSVDRWHSFWGFFGDPSRGLINVMAVILAYYLISSHFTWNRFKWVARGMVVSNIIVVIWTILAIRGVNFLPQKIAAFSPISLLGSITGLGIYLNLMVPILMSFVFKASEIKIKWKKIFLTSSLLILILLNFFIILSLSSYLFSSKSFFDSSLGFVVGLSFFLVYILARIVKPSQNWVWLPMASFAFILAILMVGSVNFAKINLPVEVSPGTSLSLTVAKESLKEKFFLGAGPGQYGYAFSLHKPKDFNDNSLYNLRFYDGSGVVFESLSTIGALGTISLMLILLTFLGVIIYLLSRDKEKNKIYSLGFVSAAIIFLINALMLRMSGSILLVGVIISILAMALVIKESDSEERNFSLSLKASPKFALTLAFIFMVIATGVIFLFIFVGKVFVADMYIGSANREAAISETGSVAKVLKAIDLYGKESRYYSRLSQEYMALVNQEIAKGEGDRDLNKVQTYLNNSITAANMGKDLMKNDVLATEVSAQVYESAGVYVPDSLPLTEAAYKRAQELEPENPNFYLKLGQTKEALVATKQDEAEKKQLIQEAGDLFQKSIDEKSNFDAGYYNLALVKQALGDMDSAVENMQKAISYNNQNINYFYGLAGLLQTRNKNDDMKNAEAIYKNILEVSPNEVNVHLSLGMLYEGSKRKQEAIDEYQKVMDLLPADSKDARDKVSKMISNTKNGVPNNAETLGVATPTAKEETGGTTPNQEVPNQNPGMPGQGQSGPIQQPVVVPEAAPAP
jgi:cytochrome c-type biogenesis protein CcmH/NrfG